MRIYALSKNYTQEDVLQKDIHAIVEEAKEGRFDKNLYLNQKIQILPSLKRLLTR